MVAQLLRLRLTLASNTLRRTPAQLTRWALAVVLSLGAAAGVAAMLVHLGSVEGDVAGPIVTIIGSVVTLGFFLAPVVYGVAEALDPRAFALSGITARRLSPALAVVALVSVPTVAVAIVAVAQVATWNRSPAAATVAIVCAVFSVFGAVLGARVAGALVSFVLARHRSRDFSTVVSILVVFALAPGVVALARADSLADVVREVGPAAAVLGWTPFGAAWAAPAAAAAGHTGETTAKVAIALISVVLLAWAWHTLVGRMLVTTHGKVAAKPAHGLGWFGRFPATPSGAVAARSLSYWGRDPRYAVSLAIIPIIPVLLLLPLLFAGVPSGVLALIPVPVAALLLGWTLHNDVAYDNTAIWLHITSGIRGYADRFGRAIPTLLVGIPFIVIGALVSARVYGNPAVLPSMVGVGLGILFVGVGVSSVVSAWFPYPVVPPGSSPFTSPQSSGSTSPLSQSLSFVVILVLSTPVVFFAAQGLIAGGDGGDWPQLALLTGIAGGLCVLLVGVFLGGFIFDRRSTDLYTFSVRN